MSRAAGYITDTPYIARYHRELNPSILKLALALQGVRWEQSAADYLELGCGFGLPALFNAAGHPGMKITAVDINPEHIHTAKGIAAAANLANVRFIEAAFADLEAAAPGDFDVIALHGVWSWINAENRAHILRFAGHHLRPGGIVYVSYNALPGLASTLPLREVMRGIYDRTTGATEDRVDAAVKFAARLRDAGAAYFKQNPRAALTLDAILPKARNALAHEYFNADWCSFYHRDVARQMAPLGLTYVASAHLFDNMDHLNYPVAALELLHGQDPADAETLKDYFANREFRRDVYIRGAVSRTDAVDLLREIRFAASGGPGGLEAISGQTALGKITVKPELGIPVLTALSGEPMTAEAVWKSTACAGLRPADVLETLIMLTAMGAAEPALDPEGFDARKAATDRLNAVLWEAALQVDVIHAAVSPLTGGGIALDRIEQLFLLALQQGEDAETFLRRAFGTTVQGDVRTNHARFVEKRLPLLQKFGIG